MVGTKAVDWKRSLALATLLLPLAGCVGLDEPEADWGRPQSAPAYVTVHVRSGDTLSQIAARYDTSTEALARLNGVSNANAIHAGDILRVPATSHAAREPAFADATSQPARLNPVALSPRHSTAVTGEGNGRIQVETLPELKPARSEASVPAAASAEKPVVTRSSTASRKTRVQVAANPPKARTPAWYTSDAAAPQEQPAAQQPVAPVQQSSSPLSPALSAMLDSVSGATPPKADSPKPSAAAQPPVGNREQPPGEVQQAEYVPGSPRFVWPVSGRIISEFGATVSGERNDGINIAAGAGQPIRAAASGVVTYAGNELRNYGNLLFIKHDDGYVTAYAHAQNIIVKKGDYVRKGQVVAYVGQTGDVSQPQLHFEIRRDLQPVNPKPLLVAAR